MSPAALVVDDSMLIRHTVCRFLEARGYEVDSATNGAEALEKLATCLPAVIITDLEMPRMSGLELIAALQARPETAAIPVVVLAGRRTDSEPALDLRANFIIHKETDIEQQLEKALAAVLGTGSVR
jgi:two-component system chemotaxis response regulator CheY